MRILVISYLRQYRSFSHLFVPTLCTTCRPLKVLQTGINVVLLRKIDSKGCGL